MKKTVNQTYIRQILLFTAVGVSSSAVNWCVYNGMLLVLQSLDQFPGFDFLIAQAFGFLLSVAWSFQLNRRYVFTAPEERAVPWPEILLKVYVTYSVTGIGLSSLLSLLWVYVFDIPKEILTVLNDSLCFPVNFLLNKYWSFRKT